MRWITLFTFWTTGAWLIVGTHSFFCQFSHLLSLIIRWTPLWFLETDGHLGRDCQRSSFYLGRFPKVRAGRPDQTFWQWNKLFAIGFTEKPSSLCIIRICLVWIKVKFSLRWVWAGWSVLINQESALIRVDCIQINEALLGWNSDRRHGHIAT